MPLNALPTLNFHDVYALAPEIVLTVWGLFVLILDVVRYRGRPGPDRQKAIGAITLLGVLVALGAALYPLLHYNQYRPDILVAGVEQHIDSNATIFFGALSNNLLTVLFNILLVILLALVCRLSMAWSFTENWGEYFALLLWSTVGMMLLTASEELLTLFLTLETMTICLYLLTAFEKTRRRSAEGGLKYFVYGSVSSALFLFGLSLVYGLTGSTQFTAIRAAMEPESGLAVGLSSNVAGTLAVLLLLVGFGFKIAAVPFHQWAPDAYEGAPAPVTSWVATGSKIASFVALMKVLLHALGPLASRAENYSSPGWIGIVAVLSAASMTFGNFAALPQRNLKRMLAYSSIAHAGYMLVGVVAAGVSVKHEESAGSVLFYLVIYAFSNLGAFAVAAWLVRDKGTDDIDDLNGLGLQYPGLGLCILLLMLSLIGMPPLAGFFGKLYMFMEALNQSQHGRLTLMWLVALGLLNSVVSAFYYVRVLKAMFLRKPERTVLAPASSAIALPIVLATAVVIGLGVYPSPLLNLMKSAAVPMLQVSELVVDGGGNRTFHGGPDMPSELPDPVFAPAPPREANSPPPGSAAIPVPRPEAP